MRLWGRVVQGGLLVAAAVFGILTAAVPEARWAAALATVILLVVAFAGIPALVRLVMTFTGDEAVLETGLPVDAAITSLAPTGWRYNRVDPIVRFGLSVRLGGAPYAVRVTQAVAPDVLARLAPGAVVEVRVDRADRRRVVIDWRQRVRLA